MPAQCSCVPHCWWSCDFWQRAIRLHESRQPLGGVSVTADVFRRALPCEWCRRPTLCRKFSHLVPVVICGLCAAVDFNEDYPEDTPAFWNTRVRIAYAIRVTRERREAARRAP